MPPRWPKLCRVASGPRGLKCPIPKGRHRPTDLGGAIREFKEGKLEFPRRSQSRHRAKTCRFGKAPSFNRPRRLLWRTLKALAGNTSSRQKTPVAAKGPLLGASLTISAPTMGPGIDVDFSALQDNQAGELSASGM